MSLTFKSSALKWIDQFAFYTQGIKPNKQNRITELGSYTEDEIWT